MQQQVYPGQPTGPSDPLEALEEEVRQAQRKLAYFEHFGTLMEHPISEAVRRAVDRDMDFERTLAALRGEITELRGQLAFLEREVAQQTAETERRISDARREAASVIAGTSEHATRAVRDAIARLETGIAPLASATGSSSSRSSEGPFESTSPPVGAPAFEPEPTPPSTPDQAGMWQAAAESVRDNDPTETWGASDTLAGPAMSMPEGLEVNLDAVTRLRVHLEDQGALDRLVHVLESRLGAGTVAVADSGPEDSDLLVTHNHDTSLLGHLLTLDSLEFRPIGRSEGFLEIEVRSV